MLTETPAYTLSPALERVVECFRKYLYLPDPTPLLVVLAVVAANFSGGDPVWVILIGASSSGKTEILSSILGLSNMHEVSTLNESSLLSGTAAKDHAKNAKGGLLREIRTFGIVVMKDFTSLLSINRDERTKVLAALREIFDGRWVRRIGGEGGTTLPWEGKVGLLAGCTDEIENHQQVISSMGDRYLRLRMPKVDPKQQGMRSQANQRRETEMRSSLRASVTALFSGLDLTTPIEISEDYRFKVNSLATFVALARSPVERDSYKRDIQYVPDPENPARLSKSLVSLFAGALAIGMTPESAFDCTCKVALDCIPKVRLQVVKAMLLAATEPYVIQLQNDLRLPESTVRRTLEDLNAHGILEPFDGSSRTWYFTQDAAILLGDAGIL